MARLPKSETRAVWMIALFAAVQCADALQTAHGVQRFGYSIEANPVLSYAFTAVGPTAALVGAKLIALLCGATLYLSGRYAALAGLTVLVVFLAIVPWAFVLA